MFQRKIKNCFIALLLGLSCHLLIISLNRLLGERVGIPFIRTGLYGLAMIFLGIGPFIYKIERFLLKNSGITIICATSLIFVSNACFTITVLNWNCLYSYLTNRQTHCTLFNPTGIVSVIILIVCGASFALLLGNRFGNLLKISENPVLILASYSSGFLLAALLVILLLPVSGPAALLSFAVILFLFYLWTKNRKARFVFTALLSILVFCFSYYKNFSRTSVIGCNDPERILTVWSPYSRLDFIRAKDKSRKEWLIANYNFCPVWVTSSNVDIEKQIGQFPIAEFGRQEKILIIGAAGGFSLRAILAKNPKASVIANEIDPTVIRMMKGKLSRYNDGKYNDIRVQVAAGDGSLFLERLVRQGNQRFDKIIYDGTDSEFFALSRSLAPMDCYLYTREAFENVEKLLKPDGIFLNYMTAMQFEDVSHVFSGMGRLFSYRFAFARLAAPFPTQGHPYCFIVAAKNENRLNSYLNNIADISRYDFTSLEDGRLARQATLTYDKPMLAPRFVKILLFLFVLSSLSVSAFFLSITGGRSVSWQLAISSFFLGIGYIFVELLILDKISRYFLDPTFGQSISFSLFLFAQIISIYLMSRKLRNKCIILFPCFVMGLVFFLPKTFPYPLLVSVLLGFACGMYFPYIISNSDRGNLEKLYGLDVLGSITGLFLYFLTVFIFGFYAASIAALVLYAFITALLLLAPGAMVSLPKFAGR